MYSTITLNEFKTTFSNEETCLKFIAKHKWPDGFRCPICNNNKAYLIKKRRLYQCTKCKHQASITADTVFHKTRKPLTDWFWAIFLMATRTNGTSARQLTFDLHIAYQTAWSWCHKIRNAMKEHDINYFLNDTIELDETYIGGKKKPGKRGRGAANKAPILVAVEADDKGCGHVCLSKVTSLTSEEVQSFVQSKVAYDSSIISDGLSIYNCLNGNYILTQVTVGSGTALAIRLLPHVHTVIGRLKNWLRATYSSISSKHLDLYLAEFAYRFNRRFKNRRKSIFDRLISVCSTNMTVTYTQLIAELNG